MEDKGENLAINSKFQDAQGKMDSTENLQKGIGERQKNNHENEWRKWNRKKKGGWVGTKTKIEHICIIELQKLSSVNRKNI